MIYNLITNIQNCYVDIPPLLYYSHIPSAIIIIIIGLFILIKKNNNKISGLVLFLISLFSLTWITLALVVWLTYSSVTMMFLWSFFPIIYVSIFILSLYFTYTTIDKKDVSKFIKYIFSLLLLPLILLTPSAYNLTKFDTNNCQPFENLYLNLYQYIIGVIIIVWIITFIFIRYKNAAKGNRGQILSIGLGILFFLVAFSWSEVVGSLTENFTVTQYGLFGMPFFVGFLVYSIVKFHTFDIKLIGSQALVWALVILVGAQFFFIQTNINRVLTAITLIISALVGLIIVRSVKKEIAQKEHIEKIAGELKIANEGQENLIHVMNHQIKGFFGIARNIFAELLTDDYGQMPMEAKPLLEKGLQSTSTGVDYVQDILRGSSAAKGILPYDMKPVDVKAVVSGLLIDQKEIAEKKGLSFVSEVSLGDFNTIGDRTHLREAFKNLITNAIKYNDYNDPNRGIKVFLTEKNNRIVFSVRDTGIGIAEEDKPRLFTAGGMGKDSTKYNVESSGFGLAFVKGVAEAHNGNVGFKSNAPEKGTTFFIELPIIKISSNLKT